MARVPTTSDVFNAIAEPKRRQIIELLADGKSQAVGDLVSRLRMPQPVVSKHLGVLKQVGIVSVLQQGRHRLYQLQPRELKPVHDWVKEFERYWSHQLDRIKARAEQMAKERGGSSPESPRKDG
jgi:DNA-binding transcriptional ArsR family regulator